MRTAVMAWSMAIGVAIAHPAAQDVPEASAAGVQPFLHPDVTRVVEPTYPPVAVAGGVSGTVVVGVAIDAEGQIRSARIAQSIPPLDDAALDAVRQWQFAPPVVDGTPRPTGVNVSVEFVLGGAADAPVPSVPAPRPSWVPEDFAFEYALRCRSGAAARMDLAEYTPLGREDSAPSGAVPLAFTGDELGAIYLRAVAAGTFSTPGPTWRQSAGVRQAPDGFHVTVVGALPPLMTLTQRSVSFHTLDIRHYRTWRRVEWREPGDDDRADAHEQLETVGALIREIVAQKPAVRELTRDERVCLED